MHRPSVCAAMALLAIAPAATCLAAKSYQPAGHVTRGIYAHLHHVMATTVWTEWAGGYAFVDRDAHGGRACVRCVGKAGTRGQGVSQRVTFDQTAPRPIKIAGWSRCENVTGPKSWRYSLYVDFVLTDGTPWHMKIAPFDTGTHGWQYAETVVTPPKPVRQASCHAFIRQRDGTVWFDDLFLGELGATNRLRCPGFEAHDRVDRSRRDKLFADLARLHCNAVHGYLSGAPDDWTRSSSKHRDVMGLLDDARRRGIGVWVTTHVPYGKPMRNATDPNFPQHFCVNGPWGLRWTEALSALARYPFAGLSVVPDEFVWSNSRLTRQYRQHPDPKVREFYAKLPAYCDCPVCRKRFVAKHGEPFPRLAHGDLRSADLQHRRWLRFRYDSTTDWLRRTCAAVRKANPAVRTDSLICVTPLCSDRWYRPGVAWDRAGYEAGLEYATTDPYILLHNYLGDSTHWYVTETAEHLAAASPRRRCGVVLEASRLRTTDRELDPVETYGSALSAVWHGADELAWWHHVHVMDIRHTTERPELSRACVRGVYSLLEKIDPWLQGVTPQPGVALLFSRASCDIWRLYMQATDAKPPFDTRGITDPRHASIAQKEALYLLLRTGVAVTLYYLESVRKEELAPHRVILVPFPLAVDRDRAKLVESLAQDGKRVVILGPDGPLDEMGTPHKTPVLHGLDPGKGKIVFVPRDVLDRLPASRDNETRKGKVTPTPLSPATARTILGAVTDAAASPPIRPLMTGRVPTGDDVELCCSVNARGDRLLLAINWDTRPRAVTLPNERGLVGRPIQAYRLGPDGKWAVWQGTLGPRLRLKPQEAWVARLK